MVLLYFFLYKLPSSEIESVKPRVSNLKMYCPYPLLEYLVVLKGVKSVMKYIKEKCIIKKVNPLGNFNVWFAEKDGNTGCEDICEKIDMWLKIEKEINAFKYDCSVKKAEKVYSTLQKKLLE